MTIAAAILASLNEVAAGDVRSETDSLTLDAVEALGMEEVRALLTVAVAGGRPQSTGSKRRRAAWDALWAAGMGAERDAGIAAQCGVAAQATWASQADFVAAQDAGRIRYYAAVEALDAAARDKGMYVGGAFEQVLLEAMEALGLSEEIVMTDNWVEAHYTGAAASIQRDLRAMLHQEPAGAWDAIDSRIAGL